MCYSELTEAQSIYNCQVCGFKSKIQSNKHSDHTEKILDFTVNYPDFCKPIQIKKWEEIQKEYINYVVEKADIDSYELYDDQIKSGWDLYNKEYDVKGNILDVGGFQGRFRQFLKDKKDINYISADPYYQSFLDVENQSNLLKAYTCLSIPCNFVCCSAEMLPFKSNTFDWVNSKSVLDHIENPVLAFKEAYRVLKPGGKFLLNITTFGEKSKFKNVKDILPPQLGFIDRIINRFKTNGIQGILKAIQRRVTGDDSYKYEKTNAELHLHFFYYENILELFHQTNFKVIKEYWEPPPYDGVLTICGEKN
jgi:ubiquinone/menaquinone biosynthesis C-methylase UbiE